MPHCNVVSVEEAAVTSGVKAAGVACGAGMWPGFVRAIADRFAVPVTAGGLEFVAAGLEVSM